MNTLRISLLASVVFCASFSASVMACIAPLTAILKVWPNNNANPSNTVYVIGGKPVLLDGSLSIPAAGSQIVKYEWYVNNDGVYEYAESELIFTDGAGDKRFWYTFPVQGQSYTVTVKLRVTGANGVTSIQSRSINVSPDENSNGLPDAWETLYNGLTRDTDGADDLCEYLHGSNPTSGDSTPTSGTLFVYPGGKSIQEMYNKSIAGDTIVILPGIYLQNVTFDQAGRIITSIAPDNWEITARTVLSPALQSTDPVVTFNGSAASTTVFKGFTVTGGQAGIYCNGVSPTINNCLIQSNGSLGGSGIVGGVYLQSSSAAIFNCFIVDNKGTNGAGLFKSGGTATLSNCVFYGNSSTADGGAIYNASGVLTVKNCTLAKNLASRGAGIYINGTGCAYKNSIIWGNTSAQSGNQIDGTSASITTCFIQDVSNNPSFCNINNPAGPDGVFGTRDDGLRLKTDSQCIDAGETLATPYEDIIGQFDVNNNNVSGLLIVDIGAYELNQIWYVKTNGSGSGVSWASATSFQEILQSTSVQFGDEIWVAGGVYTPGPAGQRNSSFQLKPYVAVYGGFVGTEKDFAQRNTAINPTILSGDLNSNGRDNYDSYRVVKGASEALLDGFRITGGNANINGAHYGGGILADPADMTIRNCTFANNFASGYGGGIYAYLSSISMQNCVFVNNDSDIWGGGVYLVGLRPLSGLTNCTIAGNKATNRGGGIFVNSGTLLVQNSIVHSNIAPFNPNLTFNETSSKPIVRFSDIEKCYAEGGWVSTFGVDGGGNIKDDPLFEQNSVELSASSPCINQADRLASPVMDIRGIARFYLYSSNSDAQSPDMGALEFLLDTDGDGLLDNQEEFLGTDIAKPDTDGDGMPDGWEVTYDLDPLDDSDAQVDSDLPNGDGYANLCEYLHDTDPTVYNSNMSPISIAVQPEGLTIQQAIDGSIDHDTIIVADGTYTGDGNRDIDFKGKAITVRSANGPEACIIDCQGAARGFYFHTGETNSSVLDGFTIQNGYANDDKGYGTTGCGGGILCGDRHIPYKFASPTIKNCIIKANTASQYGGGMFNVGKDATSRSCPVVYNCLFIENSANWGGAMYNKYDSCPTLINCTIAGNSFASGGSTGGIYNYSTGSSILVNCILWGNTGSYQYAGNANCSVTYSCISGTSIYPGQGNTNSNPQFVSGGFQLQSDSPCIDAGNNTAIPSGLSKDLAGNLRKVDSPGSLDAGFPPDNAPYVDMGAYEYDKTIYVDDNGQYDPLPGDPSSSDPGENGSWSHPFDAIQEGINAAVAGESVTVLDGTYTGLGNRDIDFGGKAITVRSMNGPANCIVDCQGTADDRHRGFYFQSLEGPDSVLSGFTIQGGYGDYSIDYNGALRSSGGGILIRGIDYSEYTSPTIHNCIIKNNHVDDPENYADDSSWGGGIHCLTSSAQISDCVFEDNTAGDVGGGLYCRVGSPVIKGCVFRANKTDSSGGGFWIQECTVDMSGCYFEGNSVLNKNGGGGFFNYCQGNVVNCAFVGNRTQTSFSDKGGGALRILGTTGNGVNFINCTFSGNSSNTKAGGVLVNSGLVYFSNCILWANESTTDASVLASQLSGSAITVNYSCIQDCPEDGSLDGITGTGNIDLNPMFVRNPSAGTDGVWGTEDDDYGDLHLYNSCSPCIDAGDNASVSSSVTKDVEGNPRKVDDGRKAPNGDGYIDMGAYEFQYDAAVNQSPYAADDPGRCNDPYTCNGTLITIQVLSNDCDPEGISPTVYDVTQPADGQSTVTNTGTAVTYSPNGFTGTTTFKYKATDGVNISNEATVRVDVSSSHVPVANAGPDQAHTICNAADKYPVSLNGSATDAGNDINPETWTWTWTENSHTKSASGQTPTILLGAGTHDITLTVADYADNVSEPDMVRITINTNSGPTANAGSDMTVVDAAPIDGREAVALNGSASTGDIVEYVWYEDNKIIATGATANSLPLAIDEHHVYLVVHDSCGNTDSDEVVITVKTAPLDVPDIDAGPAQETTLPLQENQTFTLHGVLLSNPGDVITNYQWDPISIPAGGIATITSGGNTLEPGIQLATNIAGTYVFKLIGKDASGVEVDSDVTTVTVRSTPGSNNAPTVRAWIGGTQSTQESTISLSGGNAVETLNGKITDDGQPSGTLTGKWQKLSGPVGGVIFTPLQQECSNNCTDFTLNPTTATFKENGSYILALVGSDGISSAQSVVQITVSSLQPPLVEAGENKFEVLRNGRATVEMKDAYVTEKNAPFNNAAITWTKESGPGTVEFDSTGKINCVATFSAVGTYQLKLTAADGADYQSQDTVWVSITETSPPEEPAEEKKIYAGGSKNNDTPSIGARVYRRIFGKEQQWTALPENNPKEFTEDAILSLCECYGSIFAGTKGTNGHVYRFDTEQQQWADITDGTLFADVTAVYCLVKYNQQLYAGTNVSNALFKYDYDTGTWTTIEGVTGHSSGIHTMRVWKGKLFLDANKSAQQGYFDGTWKNVD